MRSTIRQTHQFVPRRDDTDCDKGEIDESGEAHLGQVCRLGQNQIETAQKGQCDRNISCVKFGFGREEKYKARKSHTDKRNNYMENQDHASIIPYFRNASAEIITQSKVRTISEKRNIFRAHRRSSVLAFKPLMHKLSQIKPNNTATTRYE